MADAKTALQQQIKKFKKAQDAAKEEVKRLQAIRASSSARLSPSETRPFSTGS